MEQAQALAGTAPHPTRSAPLCKHCVHQLDVGRSCNHPAYPVNLADGWPKFTCAQARRALKEWAYEGWPAELPLCGPEAALFQPASSTAVTR